MQNRIYAKLRQTYPQASDLWCIATARVLANNLTPALLPNLVEWLEDKPFSPIVIHGKYCLQDVLDIFGSSDVANALLALDVYAHDPAREAVLFPEVM